MCFGFNGFGQLGVESHGREDAAGLTVDAPRLLLELPCAPASVAISSCWDSLYVHASTAGGRTSHSLCTGRWASDIEEAKRSLQEGDDILEVAESPRGQLLLRSGEGRLLVVLSGAAGSLEVRESEDKSSKDVSKMRCLNDGTVFLLLASGAVHECVFDTTQSRGLKLSRELPVGGGAGQRVSDIACGADHCLLLTSTGNIFSLGLGTRGQLGHGDITSRTEPSLVQTLAGVPMRAIACGLWHSLVLSRNGDLYSWGWNEDGQLGLRDPPGSTVALPASVDVVSEESTSGDVVIVSVSCGARHSAAVSERGELICWGWDRHGQVGGAKLSGSGRVLSVHCSHWSTLFTQL